MRKLKNTILLILISGTSALAAGNGSVPQWVNDLGNPVLLLMITCAILLLLLIAVLGKTLKAGAILHEEKRSGKSTIVKLIALLLLSGNTVFAQDTIANDQPVVPFDYFGINPFLFSLLSSVIFIELIIVYILYRAAGKFLWHKEKAVADAYVVPVKKPSFIEKMNASVSIEKEKDILLDHNYDGIQELDNNLPPWWKYGFYLTIIFAAVYMVHYHFTDGKLQIDEYHAQLAQAEIEMENYRKNAADLVDENTAVFLSEASAIEAGMKTFTTYCTACHGGKGEGGVGPNLTDDYWIHKGSINDIFKIVKYGWPEKGMKSWQQDLSARQIQEVSSYIMTLRGSNPPNAKEKQGEFYVSESDSVAVKTDSTSLVMK